MRYTELFNDKSGIYASARPTYPADFYRFLSTLCPASACAWDCACGNGQSAVDLAAFFESVFATDISSNQIDNAFAHPNVCYAVSASENTQFADQQFDLVCVAQALHWMKFDRFWPEARRVLKPGGVFATCGYCWPTVSADIDQLLQDTFMVSISPYWADQNRMLWDHYQQLDIPFEKIASPEFPMVMHWNQNQYFAFLHSWSATRRCMDELGEGFFNDAYERVSALWGEAEVTRNVRLDFFNLVYRR